MTKAVKKYFSKYFGENIDLNIQSFNLLGFAGMIASFAIAVMSLSQNAFANAAICLVALFIAFGMINVAGNWVSYQICRRIIVIAVFIIAFPFMFFYSGGYLGGMPCFFIFAIIFSAVMLSKNERVVALTIEFVLYIGCCLAAYFLPGFVYRFSNETDYLIDVTMSFAVCSLLITLVILLHIRMYNIRNKELERANVQLEDLNRMKTEFLQDMSHEMQNPLTTITRGIGHAESRMDKPNGTEAARDVLKMAEEEALRLGRMVTSMVNLADIRGDTENREKADLSLMLGDCAEALKFSFESGANTILIDIEPDLPLVYATVDRLKQVVINILANSAKHTRNGDIILKAFLENNFISVCISDTGEGISPELLPRVFERGVSGKESSGYGLSICRTIVEAHGGKINIDSTEGKGTTVIFTLPVYEGQSENRI